jgi:hypothetical protein
MRSETRPRALTHLEAPVEGGGIHQRRADRGQLTQCGCKRHRAPFTWNAHGLNATARGCWSTLRVCPTGRPHATHVLICPGESATRCGYPAWRSDPSPVLQLRRNRRAIRPRGLGNQTGRHDPGGSRVDRAWLRMEASPGSGNVGRIRRSAAPLRLGCLHHRVRARSRRHVRHAGRRPGGITAIASVRPQELQAAGEILPGRASRRSPKESSRAGSPESRTRSAVLSLLGGPCSRCRWGEHSMTAAEDAHTNDGGTDQHNQGAL